MRHVIWLGVSVSGFACVIQTMRRDAGRFATFCPASRKTGKPKQCDNSALIGKTLRRHRHNSRERRNFCPPTSEGGDPPRLLCRRFKDDGLPRSARKRVGGQYFRSLARLPRTSQFLSTCLGGRGSARVTLSTLQGWRTTALRRQKSGWTIFSIPGATTADTAIFVHLPPRPEIRQGYSADGSRMADYRAPQTKEWVDNIFDPWRDYRGHRNFCPPTSEAGDPPRLLCRRLKDGGLPRSADKRVGGQYFRSLARLPRTPQFLSTYLGDPPASEIQPSLGPICLGAPSTRTNN